MSICINNYILKYTPPKERDFLSYLDDLKNEQTMENPGKYFQNVKIVNFDIIHHECRGVPLQNLFHHYYAITKKDFTSYKKK